MTGVSPRGLDPTSIHTYTPILLGHFYLMFHVLVHAHHCTLIMAVHAVLLIRNILRNGYMNISIQEFKFDLRWEIIGHRQHSIIQ